jgi:hypothetical protein
MPQYKQKNKTIVRMKEDGQALTFLGNYNAKGNLSGCAGESELKVGTIKLLMAISVEICCASSYTRVQQLPPISIFLQLQVEPSSTRAS